jgi:signal transduction histidine kinase
MSHELRTPLNAILGFSEIIERQMFGAISKTYVGYAHDIHFSGRHLLELVDDVLDLAKLEAGKLQLRESKVSLPEVVEECFALVRGRAGAGQVRLEAEFSAAPALLLADRRSIKQLVLNYLSNAVKFTPEGGCVTVRETRTLNGETTISVSDTGIGMSAPEIEIALSPFGQIDSKLARKNEGTGLGLPICKSLVQLHGGEMVVTSSPGEGTTMSAKFPAFRTVSVQSSART